MSLRQAIRRGRVSALTILHWLESEKLLKSKRFERWLRQRVAKGR